MNDVAVIAGACCAVLRWMVGMRREQAVGRLGVSGCGAASASGARGPGMRWLRGRGVGRIRGAGAGARVGSRDAAAALSAVCARLRAGAELREAFEDCAGFHFATAELTPRRIEMALRARGVGDDGDVIAVARSTAWACALSGEAGCDASNCLEAVRSECSRRRDAKRNAVQALAMPRATVRILAALPAVTLLAGSMMGAHPLAFLIGGPAGWALLALGVGFEVCGAVWMRCLLRGFGTRVGLAGEARA